MFGFVHIILHLHTNLCNSILQILIGKKNPVILLITDGEENENPRIDDILENVIQSGVRVITVAFGWGLLCFFVTADTIVNDADGM